MIPHSADSSTSRQVATGGGRNERSPLRGVGIGNCRRRTCMLSSGGFESSAASSEWAREDESGAGRRQWRGQGPLWFSSWNGIGGGRFRLQWRLGLQTQSFSRWTGFKWAWQFWM